MTRRDLRERKGIPFSRQHIARLIAEGKFPPPDGKTADAPTAPNFWLEGTIDAWLKARVKAQAAKRAAAEAAETTAAI